jgi:hypothetical protein
MQLNPQNYLSHARPADNVVGTYWVLGNINRALLGAGYDLESGRAFDEARLFVRTVDQVVRLGSARAELIFDPESFRGEFARPSVVLVDRAGNLVRLPTHPGVPIAEYLSAAAIADPKVQEPTGLLPETRGEARRPEWVQEYGGLSREALGERLREANRGARQPKPARARPPRVVNPKLRCNLVPVPGIGDVAGEVALAFLARKGIEAPARWVGTLTYPLAWLDDQAQVGWTAVTGWESNHPLRWLEAVEESALEGLVDDLDWLTGGARPLGNSFMAPYDPYKKHPVTGLPCPMGT